jgi:hypothetical protein
VTGTAVETVTNSVQRGIDTLLATQKEILDTTAKKSASAKA